MSLIPDSAFITVGESAATIEKVNAGLAPSAEYAVLSRNHFSQVHAMVDEQLNAGSLTVGAKFAFRKYFEAPKHRNIYLGEEFPGIQYLAVHAAFRRKQKIVMLIHNVASQKRSIPLATLRLAGLADHLLCLSEYSKQELQSRYNYPASRVTVIGSRVDTAFFTPQPDTQVQVQVCSAGAVNRDYDTLISAMVPLGIPLKIAADTAWRYTAKVEAVRPLPPSVEMRSWENYVNLRQLYAESAVVVVPLERSVLSGVTVVLEAMAMAKPVILTWNPYVAEFLIDGENGFFVQAGDVDGLRQKIQILLDNPEHARQMGARARAWVLERFTVQRYVDRILSVW